MQLIKQNDDNIMIYNKLLHTQLCTAGSVWEYKAAAYNNNPFINCLELEENSSVLSVDTVIFSSSNILARWLKRVSIVIVVYLEGLCNQKLNELPVQKLIMNTL